MVRRALLPQQPHHSLAGCTVFVLAIVLAGSGVLQAASEDQATDAMAELLRSQIDSAGMPPRILVGATEPILSSVVPLFYQRRSYQPAWITAAGCTPAVAELVAALEASSEEGLEPTKYHLVQIQELIKNTGTQQGSDEILNRQTRVDLDLLLSDAFLTYASHLLAGRVDPHDFLSPWLLPPWYGGCSLKQPGD